VFASVTTPGVAPSAITVGALTTWATDTPDDDTVASYSSRGPTRFELGLKPDVIAPGNKIVSLRAPGAYLASKYPELIVAGGGNNGYMRMSGTSMAAGMISGGAALLLEGGVLSARQVKVAMQLSAGFMTDAGLLRAGLGRANFYSARRVNNSVTGLTGVIPPVMIAGRTVTPGGLMTRHAQPLLDGLLAPIGTRVIGPLELFARWFDLSFVDSRLAALKGSQLVWGDQLVPAQQLVWGDQSPLGQQLVWGDLTPYGQQLVWGDTTFAQQLVWGDQTLAQQLVWGDQTAAQQLVWGDQTAGQQLVWGDAQPNANQLVWGDSVRGQ
jgi:serine protease AprX